MIFKHQPVWTYNVTIFEFKLEDIPNEARDFIQRGVIPQLAENQMECDEFDVMVNFTPRPDTMNLSFILFEELKKGLLEISLPAKLDQNDICETLDDLVADALEPEYDIVIPWTQEEVNLRYLDLFIECMERPIDELVKDNRFEIAMCDECVQPGPEGQIAIIHKGIFRGYTDEDFVTEVADVIKDDLFEYMDEERLMLIREKYRRFRRKYILETHADILYEKMKQEPEEDE
jgi:hypothetical protein